MRYLVCVLLIAFWLDSFAQNVIPDFKPIIKGKTLPRTLAIQPDGKILIGSSDLQSVAEEFVSGFARINMDGSVDQSFQLDVEIEQFGFLTDIVLQEDGKFLVAGGGIFRGEELGLKRFLSDGTTDNSFRIPDGIKQVHHLALQDDGKIVALADHQPPVVRFNQDGSLDDGFHPGVGPDGWGVENFDIKIQESGKILLVGSFEKYNDQTVNGIVRLNSDGTIDDTFKSGSGFGGSPAIGSHLEFQSDGKMVIIGSFESYDGVGTKNIIRLNPDGSVDGTFIIPGPSANILQYINEVFITSSDKIILSSYSNVMRLNPDGSLDTDFNIGETAGVGGHSAPLDIREHNSQYIVTGGFGFYNGIFRQGLVILEENGDLTDFDADLSGHPTVKTAYLQDDGKIIIGGLFVGVGSTEVYNLARLNPDGTGDSSFNENLGSGPGKSVNSILVQEDGKILVGGEFFDFNKINETDHLVRLHADGTYDDTFEPQIFPDYKNIGVGSMILDDDNLIIAGSFGITNGVTTLHNFARIDLTDGNLDESFNGSDVLPKASERVYQMQKQSDGMIVLGGDNLDNNSGLLLRVDSNGDLDNSFSSLDLSNTAVLAMTILPNDEIVMGGFFSNSFASNQPSPIFRLNPNGTIIDNISLANYNGPVYDIDFTSETDFIFVGDFESINTSGPSKLAFANASGSVSEIDFSFGVKSILYESIEIDETTFFVLGTFNTIRSHNDFSGIAKLTTVNVAPVITGTDLPSSVNEDATLDFSIESIELTDPDNLFPDDFTLMVEPHENFTFNGTTISFQDHFFGEVSVMFSVSDGIETSEPFSAEISVLPVNDAPEIVGVDPIATSADTPVEIKLDQLEVEDPDNEYPVDFTLSVFEGENYTLNGDIVIPQTDFLGELHVPVTVNDGMASSEKFNVSIMVNTLTSIDLEVLERLHLFPNPASSKISVEFEQFDESEIWMQIVDVKGVLLKTPQFTLQGTRHQFDISSLPDGIYILQVFIENKMVGKTFIKN